MQSLLKLSDHQIHSVIVFTGESEFKTDMPENVVNPVGYVEFVKSKTKEVISNSEVLALINKIESNRFNRSRMNKVVLVANVKGTE